MQCEPVDSSCLDALIACLRVAKSRHVKRGRLGFGVGNCPHTSTRPQFRIMCPVGASRGVGVEGRVFIRVPFETTDRFFITCQTEGNSGPRFCYIYRWLESLETCSSHSNRLTLITSFNLNIYHRPIDPHPIKHQSVRDLINMGVSNINGVEGNAYDSATNGNAQSKFDPLFTQRVIDLMSSETKPRHREILTSLIKHVHDFCREVELTQDEWVIGVDYINSLGQSYQKNRNETWRLCDILGVES